MAEKRVGLGMPVLAIKRPQQEVELFNFALHNDCTLVISEHTSKCFICYQIINEFLQNESNKWAVVLVDDSSGPDTIPLVNTLNQMLPRKPVVFPDFNDAALLMSHQENVLLMSTNHFNECLIKGHIHANKISVVLLLTTLNTTATNHSTILKSLSKNHTTQRIIGLVDLRLQDIHNASDLKSQLDTLQATYNMPVLMSKDVLAMNAYGEEITVETFQYSPKNLSPIERNVWNVLNEISDFLKDVNLSMLSQSIQKLRAVVLWSVEVLTTFGLWSLDLMQERIQSTLSQMFEKESNKFVALAIQTCKTQFDFVQKLVNKESKTKPLHSLVMNEILAKLTPYQVLGNTTDPESEQDITDQTSGEDVAETSLNKQSTGDNASSSGPKVVEKRIQKLQDKSRFNCIIVTRSNALAKMLSKLINYMSVCNAKYNFIKCGCVIQAKDDSPEDEERTESVLQAVLQGMVNVIVTTVNQFADLFLTTFHVLIYFGIPSTYEEYYKIKHKIKGFQPKLMFVFNSNRSLKMERNLQVFEDIESEIAERVSDYITQENKGKWLSRLAEAPPCNYAPFGDDGPCVSMESSVYLINRYCRRINRGDFSNLYAQLMTTKKDLTENCVEFVSKLYLPLRCYCCSFVQGAPVQVKKGDKIDLEVGRLKSRMLASLECVKVLHRCGKMDSDLDLIEEVYVDTSTENLQNLELEEGKGRAGTNKRKRAYEIKLPSFFEDNMPRANETCFLYKIVFEDPTIYKHSRSGSLQSLTEPELELGILSRKPLPEQMPSFLVYTCKSDVTVFLQASDPLKIDETTLERIKTFHHYVFKELYKLNNQLTTLSETDGYLAVPLVPNTPSPTRTPSDNSCRIHYDFLQDLSTFFQATTYPEVKLNCSAPHKDFSFFQSKVVRRVNESANQTHYTRYFVAKVCHDLSPSSLFPDQEVAGTFADYYKNRYGIQVNLQQPLLLVQHVPTQVNFAIPRLRNQTSEELSFKETKTEIHLVPELCCVLPLSATAWSLARYLPAVVYRLEAMLRAQEMKLKVVSGINEETRDLGRVKKCGNCVRLQSFGEVHKGRSVVGEALGHADNANDSSGNNDDGDSGPNHVGASRVVDVVGNGNGDGNITAGGGGDGNITAAGNDGDDIGNGNNGTGNTDDGSNDGLTISLMLHALTAKSVGQQFHSEHLELLGDSFLKLEVSLELFLTDPEKDEWALSIYRKHLVSNDMLSTQGRRLGIPAYITIMPPDLTNTSIPPGFILETSQGGKNSSLNLYTHQVLGDKNVANSVEALIGATVVGCGRIAARQFLIWLGVAQYSSSELDAFYQHLQAHRTGAYKNSEEERPGRKEQQDPISWNVKEIVNNTKLDDSGHPTRPVPNFDHIERELGYFFKNKFLLLEALTHCSYPRFLSQVSESYQKMEFVGDAILDYLVTLYIYEHFPNLNHGDVTDFRSGLVNNFTLSFLAVQKNLHQSLRHMSPQLLDVIGQFLKFLEEQELKQGASWKTSVDAFVVGASEVEDSLIEVPKVLGDVFEALVCAIFLDSGMNLDLVWKIVFPLFMPFIDYYKDNIPRSPIRVLKETFPEVDQVTFSLARLMLSRKYKSSLRVTGYGMFEAIGRTPKIAKASVARKALQHIRNEDMKQRRKKSVT